MKRTNADGNVSNLFSDGNSTLGVPATIVDETWLNAVQEEICGVIEGAGIVLNSASNAQLFTAIKSLIQSGSLSSSISVANNQVAAANLSGMVYDKATYYAAKILYHLHRQTSLGELNEFGTLNVFYKPVADAWEIQSESFGDDAGVIFSVTSLGQIQYTSTNMSGTSYAGTLRITDSKLVLK